MEREEADHRVERAERLGRGEHVAGVERDVEASSVECAQPIEQRRGQVDPLDADPALGEEERVAAHPAADLEHALARLEPGEADELVHVAAQVARPGRPHAGFEASAK